MPEPNEYESELDRRCVAGANQLVQLCAGLKAGERAYVIGNPSTEDVIAYVVSSLENVGAEIKVDVIEEASMHGAEAPEAVADAMLNSDVIFCLTRMSMAHSGARLAASLKGARFLSLPDYSLEQLASPAQQFDFLSAQPLLNRLADIIDSGSDVRVATAAGTDLHLSIADRAANRCPGFVHAPGTLGSPPDAEVNVAPLEDRSRGLIVVDGSIPCNGIGVLGTPVTLEVRDGAIVMIESEDEAVADQLNEMMGKPGDKRRVLAEFGIGLNPLATLCGRMLEDEGCADTVHFGFGSNATIGGINTVPFHLDFIMREADVWVDGVQLLALAKPVV